jgi:hypothetical protein
MLCNILDKSGTIEMQVICTKCFEHSDPSFETENMSGQNLFQSIPDSLMQSFYLPGTREDALYKLICSYIFNIQAQGDFRSEVTTL